MHELCMLQQYYPLSSVHTYAYLLRLVAATKQKVRKVGKVVIVESGRKGWVVFPISYICLGKKRVGAKEKWG